MLIISQNVEKALWKKDQSDLARYYSFQISVVTRDEVGAFKPYLWKQAEFRKGPMFREWLLTKVSPFVHFVIASLLCLQDFIRIGYCTDCIALGKCQLLTFVS